MRGDLMADEMLLKLWKEFPTVWLLIARELDITAIQYELSEGWRESRTGIPSELLRYTNEHNAFLVRDFGPTDNFDQGMIVVARDQLIETLIAQSMGA